MADYDTEERVARALADAGIEFVRKPSLGGLRPDFVVTGPEGRTIVVQVEDWSRQRGFTKRAENLADLYEEATGADRAVVVLGELGKKTAASRVVSSNGVIEAIHRAVEETPAPRRRRPAPAETKKGTKKGAKTGKRTLFVAMPFAPEYDDVYFLGVAHVARKLGAVCTRVDQVAYTGDITEEIRREIRACSAAVVDLSEARPNVLYELGIAHALRKPTVHICSTPLGQLPFDVRNWNTIAYDKGRVHALRGKLERQLKSVFR